jgi:CBS domain-containing protein
MANTACETHLLELRATNAAELMTPDPLTVRDDVPLREAAAVMLEHGVSAVPVVDHFGRPVGVVSRLDLVAHHPEWAERFGRHANPRRYSPGDVIERGFAPEGVGRTPVAEVMTPTVYAVTADTPAREVVAKMVSLQVHRLFVRDETDRLVGVVSMTDVLRRLA